MNYLHTTSLIKGEDEEVLFQRMAVINGCMALKLQTEASAESISENTHTPFRSSTSLISMQKRWDPTQE